MKYLFFLLLFTIIHCNTNNNLEIEKQQKINELFKQLIQGIEFSIDPLYLKVYSNINHQKHLCALSMSLKYYPNNKLIEIDNNKYNSFHIDKYLHNDDYISNLNYFSIIISNNPIEYIQMLTTKQYKVSKCEINNEIWIILGKDDIYDNNKDNEYIKQLQDSLLFSQLVFSSFQFNSIWKVNNKLYNIYSNEMNIDKQLQGSIQYSDENTINNFTYYTVIWDNLYLKYSKTQLVLSNSNIYKEYLQSTQSYLLAFSSIDSSNYIPLSSLSINDLSIIDAYRIVGWSIGEKHYKSLNYIKDKQNTINIHLSSNIQSLINILGNTLDYGILNNNYLLSLFSHMESIILSDKSYDIYNYITLCHTIKDNILLSYSSDDNIFDYPLYYQNIGDGSIECGLKEYYFQAKELYLQEYSEQLFLISLNTMNISYHEEYPLYYPETLKIYYRFITIIEISIEYNIEPIFLSEFIYYSNINNKNNNIYTDTTLSSYQQFINILQHLSIWRFLQSDKDTFHLLYILNNKS